MDKILPVYEQTKQAMNFDPEDQAQLPEIPALQGGFWSDLHDKYPMSLRERIRQEQLSIGWTDEQLEQEWAWMNWLFLQERSTDGDQSAQQATAPAEHPGPASDLTASGAGDGDAGQAGPLGSDSGDQSGQAEQVRG